ncbi:unnamed protein product [Phaeothamnion confervicola]
MGDRGTTSYAFSGQTTEWEDILIKKGIVEEDDVLRGKGIDPEERRLKEAVNKAREEVAERLASVTVEDKLAAASLDELDVLEDEGLDDDAALQRYRDARLAELRAARSRERFGEVYAIGKADWVKDVTEASCDAWVVAHLHEDSVVECAVMAEALAALAPRFKEVKFVRIRSRQAIENWPEANLPAVFVYKDGVLSSQLVGIAALGGRQMRPDALEWWLASQGVLTTELEEDPVARRGGVNAVSVKRGGGGARRGACGGRGGEDSDDDVDSCGDG